MSSCSEAIGRRGATAALAGGGPPCGAQALSAQTKATRGSQFGRRAAESRDDGSALEFIIVGRQVSIVPSPNDAANRAQSVSELPRGDHEANIQIGSSHESGNQAFADVS
jgi:hypothetical protein